MSETREQLLASVDENLDHPLMRQAMYTASGAIYTEESGAVLKLSKILDDFKHQELRMLKGIRGNN